MSQPASSRPNTSSLRQIAKTRLAHFCKVAEPIVKESYLFENDHYVGVRFTSGPFCLQWMQAADFASVKRGDLLIETIGLTGDSEVRRAA